MRHLIDFPSALVMQMVRYKTELVAEVCDSVPSSQPAFKGEA